MFAALNTLTPPASRQDQRGWVAGGEDDLTGVCARDYRV